MSRRWTSEVLVLFSSCLVRRILLASKTSRNGSYSVLKSVNILRQDLNVVWELTVGLRFSSMTVFGRKEFLKGDEHILDRCLRRLGSCAMLSVVVGHILLEGRVKRTVDLARCTREVMKKLF